MDHLSPEPDPGRRVNSGPPESTGAARQKSNVTELKGTSMTQKPPSPPNSPQNAADSTDTRRAILSALLGGVGVTALQACLVKTGGESADDGPLGEVTSALATGTNIIWVDTIGTVVSPLELRAIVG